MLTSALKNVAASVLLQQGARQVATQAMLAAGQKVRLWTSLNMYLMAPSK
jgi:hypothetical protein